MKQLRATEGSVAWRAVRTSVEHSRRAATMTIPELGLSEQVREREELAWARKVMTLDASREP